MLLIIFGQANVYVLSLTYSAVAYRPTHLSKHFATVMRKKPSFFRYLPLISMVTLSLDL